MREDVVLITGANGEIGHGLINYLSDNNFAIVAIDLNPLDKELRSKVACLLYTSPSPRDRG